MLNKNNKSSDINVTQYKILLDDKVFVDDEIENIKNKLNKENYYLKSIICEIIFWNIRLLLEKNQMIIY